jgi:hypothetical protein
MAISLPLAISVGVAMAAAQASPATAPADEQLLQALVAVHDAAGTDAALAAWDEFARLVDGYRAAGIPFSEGFEVRRFRVPFEQAALFEPLTSEDAGSLAAASGHLRAYVAQFERWGDVPYPLDLDSLAEGQWLLGSVLLRLGQARRESGDLDGARVAWAESRDVLRRAIEAIIDQPLDEAPRGGRVPGGTRFGMIADALLRDVALLDDPEAYAAEAARLFAWQPLDDHSIIVQMRQQAWEWSDRPELAGVARALFALVRHGHREWWSGEYAHLADNTIALLGGARAALRLGLHEEAEALLRELHALLPRIDDPEIREAFERELEALRAQQVSEAWLAEFLAMLEAEGGATELGRRADGASPSPGVIDDASSARSPPRETSRAERSGEVGPGAGGGAAASSRAMPGIVGQVDRGRAAVTVCLGAAAAAVAIGIVVRFARRLAR